MQPKSTKPLIWTAVLGFLYLTAIVGFSLDALSSFFKHLFPYYILVTTITLLTFHRKLENNILIYTLVVFFSSFLIEVAGVRTKLIFGNYSYGETLGVKFLGVPITVGANWLILSYASCCIACRTAKSNTVRALISALLILFIDIIMEPVAFHFDFRSWFENDIPLRNYMVRFSLSATYALFFLFLEVDYRNKIARNIYLILLFFFIALNIN